MDPLSQLMQLGGAQGVDGTLDPTSAPVGRLGGALARLGGGPAPGQGNGQSSADGYSAGNDMAGGAQAAAMNPLLAGLASWGQDQKIQKGANEVLQAKGIETGGSQQPRSGGQPQDVGALVQQLQQDYDRAKQSGASLTQTTEQLAQKALEGEQKPEEAQQQGDGGGAMDGAGAMDGSGGAGGASGGGQNGGSAPLGGEGSSMQPQAISQDRQTGNLTAGASQMLDGALAGDKDFDQLFGQFGQGTEGNCAAIASIKAAMDVYDNKVFDQVQKGEDGSYTIKMQDGKEVKISAAELGQAAVASNLDGPDSEAKSFAIMAYAAMAKRAEMEGHEGSRNYTQALNSLANGDNPYDSARFLGLENQVQAVNPQQANGSNAVVAWNDKHAVYIDSSRNGTRTDHYGTGTTYNGTDTNGRQLTDGFTFRPRSTSAASSSSSASSSTPSTSSSSSSSSSSSPSSSSTSSSGSSSSSSSSSSSTSSTSRSSSASSSPSSSSTSSSRSASTSSSKSSSSSSKT